jgi:hypothetical protein
MPMITSLRTYWWLVAPLSLYEEAAPAIPPHAA